ncbi:MAG TPA: hypothetical protein VMC03_09420 [Streptosporangiaceae bacterium]|nr:hypothetical protein [Streptosporangiaceae bacterium]
MRGQQAGTDDGDAVLADALAAYRIALGPRLLAGYALGSLAHGGFSPLVSDVDLALILQDPLRRADRWTMRRIAGDVRAAGGSALHRRLSVFWGTPATLRGQAAGGRFPPLDRLDLLQNGRLRTGRDARDGLPRPERSDLLVEGAKFALESLGGAGPLSHRLVDLAKTRGHPHNDATAEIRDPARLVAEGPRRLTKVVLFPVRFLFTAATGRVGTNADASEHYLAAGGAPAADLVAAALAWRTAPPAGQQPAIALVRSELVPLYVQFIDDHIARLHAEGQHALAGGFRRWRARLLA